MKSLATLAPIEREQTTTIHGQAFPIREFTSEAWEKVIRPLRDPEETDSKTIVERTLNVVIIGMEGADYEPTEADREKLTKILPNGIIREYLHRLCQLNDFGLDVMREAEKKYAATQSNDTGSN